MNLSKTNKEMVKINMYNPLINIQKDSEGSSNIKFEAPKIKNIKFEFSRRRSLSMRNRVIAKPCDIYGTKYEETNYKHEGTKLISYNETLNCMQNHLSVADSNSSVPDFKPKTLYSMIRYKKSDVRENMINIIKTQSINCQVGKHDSSDSETNATSARTPIPLGSKKNNINNKIDEDLEEETESPCILKPKFDYRAPVEVSKYPNCFNASKKAYNCMKMVRVPSTKRLRRHKFTM